MHQFQEHISPWTWRLQQLYFLVTLMHRVSYLRSPALEHWNIGYRHVARLSILEPTPWKACVLQVYPPAVCHLHSGHVWLHPVLTALNILEPVGLYNQKNGMNKITIRNWRENPPSSPYVWSFQSFHWPQVQWQLVCRFQAGIAGQSWCRTTIEQPFLCNDEPSMIFLESSSIMAETNLLIGPIFKTN